MIFIRSFVEHFLLVQQSQSWQVGNALAQIPSRFSFRCESGTFSEELLSLIGLWYRAECVKYSVHSLPREVTRNVRDSALSLPKIGFTQSRLIVLSLRVKLIS